MPSMIVLNDDDFSNIELDIDKFEVFNDFKGQMTEDEIRKLRDCLSRLRKVVNYQMRLRKK